MVFSLRTTESIEFKAFFIEVADLCHEMFQEIISTLKRKSIFFNAPAQKFYVPYNVGVLTVQSS